MYINKQSLLPLTALRSSSFFFFILFCRYAFFVGVYYLWVL